MIHTHMALWIIGAPRIDKIEVPHEKADEDEENTWIEIEVLPDGVTVTPHSEAAERLATFWDRGFTEFNVAKAVASELPGSASNPDASTWADLSSLAATVGVREGLSKVEERGVRSPESISYEAHAHCLLQGAPPPPKEEEE